MFRERIRRCKMRWINMLPLLFHVLYLFCTSSITNLREKVSSATFFSLYVPLLYLLLLWKHTSCQKINCFLFSTPISSQYQQFGQVYSTAKPKQERLYTAVAQLFILTKRKTRYYKIEQNSENLTAYRRL